ncbi:MAG: discoidin domain-containing protein, partial [Propionicimonas sp.]
SWITYDQIMAGGELEFVMGAQPSDWGREPVDPSLKPTDVTNLTATAGSTAGSATLTWDAASDVLGISGYRVYRGLDEDFAPAADNLVATTADTTYTDKPGYGVFFYKVIAVNVGDNVSEHAAHTHLSIAYSGTVPAKYAGSLMFGASGRVHAQAAAAEGAAAAFDTNETTKWSARVTDGSQDVSESADYPLGALWLEVDLGATSEVSRWFVRPETVSSSSSYKLPEFYLQVKRDGSWVDVSHVTGFQGPELDQTLGSPVTGRVFRLLIPVQTTTDANYNARIQEFHLFGTRQAASYPITIAAPQGGNATVTTDRTAAAPGETVTVDVTGIDPGMALRSLDVTHADGTSAVARVTQGVPQGTRRFTFTMDPLRTTVTAVVGADPGSPSDVQNLLADSAYSRMGRVRLTWDPATHTEGIQKYLVYRGLSEGFAPEPASLVAETAGTEFADAPGFGLFFYKVVAVSNGGAESEDAAVTWTVVRLDPAATSSTATQNLALGKAATANDYAAPVSAPTDYDLPLYTLDGRVTTKWSARDTGKLDEHGDFWLKVDLGEEYVISRWKVQHAEAGGESATYNTRDFALQALVDGTWVDIDTVAGNTAATTDRQVMPFVARTVRMHITKPVQPSVTSSISARVYEFELYSPSTGSGKYAGSLTVGKTGSVNNAVSTSENWPAAFDMNSPTKRSCRVINSMPDLSESATYPYGTLWLSVDLGASYVVNRWLMENESPSANPLYLLQVKDAGGAWVEVDRVANSTAAALIDKALPKPVAGRYFRVLIPVPDGTSNQTLNNARVREFHLFGPAATTTSPVTLSSPAGWDQVVAVDAASAALGEQVIVDVDTAAIPQGQLLATVGAAHGGGAVEVSGEAGDGVPEGVRRFTFTMPARAVTVTVTAAVRPPDTTALDQAVAAAEGLSASGYTTSSWPALAPVLDQAAGVLEAALAGEADQAAVDAAAGALEAAVAGLVERGDPIALEALVEASGEVSRKLEGFTDASARTFIEALDAARQELAVAQDRTQQQLDAAAAALQAAIAGLTVRPAAPVETDVLRSVYDSAAALGNADGKYTAGSWAALRAELATAKGVLESPTATQGEVDTAVRRLTAAISGLKVAEPLPERLKLNQTQLRLVKGKSVTLEEGVYYRNLFAAYSGRVAWKSSNPRIATVSSAGKVTAKKSGTVTITATTTQATAAGRKLTASVKVTVVSRKPKAKVTKVTASVPRTMKLGEVAYITGRYASSKATGVKVTYSTSKADIVVVDKVGRLVARTKGTEYVRVKAGGRTVQYKITVK